MTNSDKKINVYSEIGSLKTVMLHRPGQEIEVADKCDKIACRNRPKDGQATPEPDNDSQPQVCKNGHQRKE